MDQLVFKVLVYRINNNIILESDCQNKELNVEYIDITDENEILKDLIHRSDTTYNNDYIVIKSDDDCVYKRKDSGFINHKHYMDNSEASITIDMLNIHGATLFNLESHSGEYQEKINLYVLNDDNLPHHDLINIIKVNEEDDIINIEYNLSHETSPYYVFRDSNHKFVLRNIHHKYSDTKIYDELPIDFLEDNLY
ncbi:hypothetical protein DFJ63DRAFT_314715 [Scheffersomyces coipomensis]|uniref:uncharacterized protein n=1 Tax=Scheffersomyces coipomensis TaxID=1788519 RepID=UPI00315CFCCD